MGKLLHRHKNSITLNQYLLIINPACPSPIDTFANTLRAHMTTTGVNEVIAKKTNLRAPRAVCASVCVCVCVCVNVRQCVCVRVSVCV